MRLVGESPTRRDDEEKGGDHDDFQLSGKQLARRVARRAREAAHVIEARDEAGLVKDREEGRDDRQGNRGQRPSSTIAAGA